MSKTTGRWLVVLSLTLLCLGLLAVFASPAQAVPAVGIHKYYSSSSYTTQVGQLVVECDLTMSGWGTFTNYHVHTPFDCEPD